VATGGDPSSRRKVERLFKTRRHRRSGGAVLRRPQ
jgi:hypothetical protein